jgi:predicted AAA+ superfamily ATPase
MIFSKDFIERNVYVPDTDHIVVFTGIRRCGKTYTLYEIARKYPKEEVLFIDFEDERLLAINSLDNYEIILDSYKQIYPAKKPLIFFDEIQGLKNWHLFVKRLFAQGYKLFITGSNSNLLSKEIATYLTGRSFEIQIFPFSFDEFLQLKKLHFDKNEMYLKKAEISGHFFEYLVYGGFPEVIKVQKNDKRTIVKNIFNLLFYKDLISKYDKNEYLMKLIFSKLSENITKFFSISKLADKIIPLYKTSKPTVTDYFNILSFPYLINNIYQYRQSFISREMYRKSYFSDNSFILLNSVETSKSKLLENFVFIQLQRKFSEIYYYITRNNLEVDFLIVTEGNIDLFQVSWSISDFETRQREIKSLIKTMNEQTIRHATIITFNEAEIIEAEGKKIVVKSVWKWALESF